jgi:hypothetical protein
MSIGNLKDNGNKGNNFPYQLRNLQLLGEILTALNSGAGGYPTPVVRTPAMSRVTAAGTVAAGKQEVSIYNASNVVGTVLGANLKPGERVSFIAKAGDTVGAIAYDATGADFLITTLT